MELKLTNSYNLLLNNRVHEAILHGPEAEDMFTTDTVLRYYIEIM
jgi:hypothetical protein